MSFLSIILTFLFLCWVIITLFSFIPWTWHLLSNSPDSLNKIGKNATWLALVFIVIFFRSIIEITWKSIKKAKENKRRLNDT